MVDGKRKEEWDQTALLAAKIHNAFVSKRSDCRGIDAFHPYRKKIAVETPMAPDTGELLISAFCGKRE
jgi:hypothetical protein